MAHKVIPVSKFDRKEIARLVELMAKDGAKPTDKAIWKQLKALPQIEELFKQLKKHPEFGEDVA